MRRTARGATGAALLAGLLAVLTSCSTTPTAGRAAEPDPAGRLTIRIASLRGPTTMGLVGLMRDAETGAGAQDYEVTVHGSPDEVVPRVLRGEVDVALLPANLAAVLYNRTLTEDGSQVAVAAINTLGVLEVLEAGDTVDAITDLAGTTVYSTGKGATPELVLNHLLAAHGLDPATDLTVEYRSEATEVAALLASTPGAIGVLPQPYVTVLTTQNPSVRRALSLTEEWEKVSGDSAMVTGVLVVRTAFAEENPEAFADLLADYEASTAFTTSEPAAAARLIADAGIVPSAAVAEAALPACNITYVDGDEMRTLLGGYLEVLHEADPASVGGDLPGDGFYHRP